MGAQMSIDVKVKGFKMGTDIKDIVVPEKLRERRKVGIPWVDDAFGGDGLVPSTVHMLTGTPGAGKSTLARQLADALTKQGHIALYNSGEESVYQVKMASERLNLKNGFMVGQETMTAKLLTFCDNAMKDAKNKGKQFFLLQDSLQTMDDGKYVDRDGNSRGTTGNTPVRCTEMLTSWAKSTYGIVIFIGQCTKGGDFAGKNTIKHAVDGHAHIFFDEDKKSETWGERLFEVQKNRWGCNGRTYIVGMGEKGLYDKGSFKRGQDT